MEMSKWTTIGTVVVAIVVSLLIPKVFFPVGYSAGNSTNTVQYPLYENSKVVLEPQGRSDWYWYIVNGSGVAIMETFTLSKNAVLSGSWNSTIPTVVYVINYTLDKKYLQLPSNSASYSLSGSFNNTYLHAGKYLLIIGTIFHGNETVTFNQPLTATYND